MTVLEVARQREAQAAAAAKTAARDYFSALGKHHRGDKVSADEVLKLAQAAGFNLEAMAAHDAVLTKIDGLQSVVDQFAHVPTTMAAAQAEADRLTVKIRELETQVRALETQRYEHVKDREAWQFQTQRLNQAKSDLEIIARQYEGLL